MFFQGDGNDLIETNSPLEIGRFTADRTGRVDMSKAIIQKDRDTLTIGFADGSDTMMIQLSGKLADADNIRFVYKEDTQSPLIADDQLLVDNPPGQTVFFRPEATKES